MEGVMYSGWRDFVEYMRHEVPVQPRLFSDFDAAKRYLASGMKRAEQLIVAQKDDLDCSMEPRALANDLIGNIAGLRSVLKSNPTVLSKEEKGRFYTKLEEISVDLMKVARRVKRLENIAFNNGVTLIRRRLLIGVFFAFFLVVYPIVSQVSFDNDIIQVLGRTAPYAFSVFWTLTENAIKKLKDKQTKKMGIAMDIRRTAFLLVKLVLGNIASAYVQQTPPRVNTV